MDNSMVQTKRGWKLSIFTAWEGDRATIRLERELYYRWHFQAWLRNQVASCIGHDVQMRRWCEITDLEYEAGAEAFRSGELPRFGWPRGKVRGWTAARDQWLDRQRSPAA